MDWHDRITVAPKVLVGKPVIKGTRIAVEFVLELLGRGWTAEQVLQEYDHLTPGDIQACLSCAEALESRSDWVGHFSVITDDRIPMRPLPGAPPASSAAGP